MNTPPLLIAAAALVWGWQTGYWAVGALLGLALEAARLSARRIAFDDLRQTRIADLCLVLIALMGAGCFVAYGNPRAIVLTFQWLPVLLLPLALMQSWGEARAIALPVLLWGLRRRPRGAPQAINLGYLYLVALLVGACAANQRGAAGTWAMVALGAWALWAARPSHGSRLAWVVLTGCAVGIGSVLHTGLADMQAWLEGAAPEWLTGGGGTRTNPYRSSTDLGSIGELRQSDEIVLRVTTGAALDQPLLLHRASYNDHAGISWVARGARFAEVPREPDGQAWRLASGSPARSLEIADFALHGNPVLSLPAGTLTVRGGFISLKRNALGAAQAEAAPGWLFYSAGVADRGAQEAVPDALDTRVPAAEGKVLQQVLDGLSTGGLAQREVAGRIARHLREDFRYSTSGFRPVEGMTPLAQFLTRERAGHCEYFATATVLLLRAAGIPARYATGFSLQEYDPATRAYLVRERHAHAWARVWMDGAWADLDTTPPGWAALEEGQLAAPRKARAWLGDAWSGLRYRYALWQMQADGWQKWGLIGGVAALVLVWLGWRVLGGGANGRPRDLMTPAPQPVRPGLDSAFREVLEGIALHAAPRREDETVLVWLDRLRRDGHALPRPGELRDLVAIHYRLRFDPAGIDAAGQREFAARCAQWIIALRAHAATPARP